MFDEEKINALLRGEAKKTPSSPKKNQKSTQKYDSTSRKTKNKSPAPKINRQEKKMTQTGRDNPQIDIAQWVKEIETLKEEVVRLEKENIRLRNAFEDERSKRYKEKKEQGLENERQIEAYKSMFDDGPLFGRFFY